VGARGGWASGLGGDFRGYSSTVDYPGCTFWRELMQYYPTAKVLLSARDPSDWFDSTQKTIFSEENVGRILQSPMAEFFRKTVFNVVGDRIHDRDYMIAAFNAHTAEVVRGVPKERLLVYEVANGWAPLCNFLGVAIPDGPFPRVNTREEFGGRRAAGGPGGEPLDDAAVADMVRAELARLRGHT
jgi:hypothetical protein